MVEVSTFEVLIKFKHVRFAYSLRKLGQYVLLHVPNDVSGSLSCVGDRVTEQEFEILAGVEEVAGLVTIVDQIFESTFPIRAWVQVETHIAICCDRDLCSIALQTLLIFLVSPPLVVIVGFLFSIVHRHVKLHLTDFFAAPGSFFERLRVVSTFLGDRFRLPYELKQLLVPLVLGPGRSRLLDLFLLLFFLI